MKKQISMEPTIKEVLLRKIQSTEDEKLLQLLNTDYDYFSGAGDVTDGLSANEIAKLRELVLEPDDKDTVTWDEFKQVTAPWRKK